MPDLAGERIVLTRSAEDCAAWADRLERLGAAPIVFPCISTELIVDAGAAARLRDALADADWLVFTSRRGVEAWVALGPPALAAKTRIAVVGAATAEAARAHLGRADLVGNATARALGQAVAASPEFRPGATCVIAVAENARDALEETLASAGARCLRFDVYRTIPSEAREPKIAWSSLGADNVVFASPTAVEGFLNRVTVDADCEVFTIGPSTSAAARARNLPVTAQAREPSLDAIVESIVESLHA